MVTSPNVTRRRAPGDRDANAEGDRDANAEGDRDANAEGDRESDERAGLGVRDGSPRRFAGRGAESARAGLALLAFSRVPVFVFCRALGLPGFRTGLRPLGGFSTRDAGEAAFETPSGPADAGRSRRVRGLEALVDIGRRVRRSGVSRSSDSKRPPASVCVDPRTE